MASCITSDFEYAYHASYSWRIMAIMMLQSEWKIYRNDIKQFATNQKIMGIFFYIFQIYNEPISIGKTYVGNIYVAYLSVDLKMDIIDVT